MIGYRPLSLIQWCWKVVTPGICAVRALPGAACIPPTHPPTYPRTSAPQSPDLAEAETEEVMSPWGPSAPSEGPRHLTLFKAGIVGTVSGLGQGASLGPQPCNQLAV